MKKQKVKIFGKEGFVRYIFDLRDQNRGWISVLTYDVYKNFEDIQEKEIYNGEMEMPIMEVGENIFVESIGKSLEITHKARSTNNHYVYWVRDADHPEGLVCEIEDEKSEKTKQEADIEKRVREEIEKIKEEQNELERKQAQEKMESESSKYTLVDPEPKRKWYYLWLK